MFYIKYIFGKVFKNSIKLLKSPFLVMLLIFFSKSTKGKLGALRAILGYFGIRALEGHLGTRVLKALGHLGTQTFGHLDTRGHSKVNQAIETLYLADSYITRISGEN